MCVNDFFPSFVFTNTRSLDRMEVAASAGFGKRGTKLDDGIDWRMKPVMVPASCVWSLVGETVLFESFADGTGVLQSRGGAGRGQTSQQQVPMERNASVASSAFFKYLPAHYLTTLGTANAEIKAGAAAPPRPPSTLPGMQNYHKFFLCSG